MSEENKITKRSDLFREYARVIDMCEGDDFKAFGCCKYQGEACRVQPNITGRLKDYEFALAIVEDQPVFKGDVLWTKDGDKKMITCFDGPYLRSSSGGYFLAECLSWQEQKLTITINGKEYHAPCNQDKHQQDNVIRFSMPTITGYFFDSLKDAEDVYKAIVDLLNGR